MKKIFKKLLSFNLSILPFVFLSLFFGGVAVYLCIINSDGWGYFLFSSVYIAVEVIDYE